MRSRPMLNKDFYQGWTRTMPFESMPKERPAWIRAWAFDTVENILYSD